MGTVSIEEANVRLSELVHGLTLGDEVVIVENDQPVARIIAAVPPPQRPPRRLGTLQGTVLYTAPDFDAPPEEFQEYADFTHAADIPADTGPVGLTQVDSLH